MSSPIKTVTNPRDVAPPPAPKKVKPSQPSPTEVTIPLFFLHGPAPGAPAADRTRRVSLFDQPGVIRCLQF